MKLYITTITSRHPVFTETDPPKQRASWLMAQSGLMASMLMASPYRHSCC